MLIPTLASDWYRIVEYPGYHLNDFCLFKDSECTWHAIGIMGSGDWASEIRLFHSTSGSLTERFVNRTPLFESMPAWVNAKRSSNDRPQKHAPFVVFHEGEYHMFYRRPWGTILHVRTRDPYHWPDEVELVFEESDARDICIVRHDGVYLMYYCQNAEVDGVGRSCIMLRRSSDLVTWTDATVVHHDTSEVTSHTFLESPFVVRRPEGFHLVIRNRSLESTTLHFSQSPEHFESGSRTWRAEIPDAHAPEIVEDSGQYYIAGVSGSVRAKADPDGLTGWVELALLRFVSMDSVSNSKRSPCATNGGLDSRNLPPRAAK